MQKFSKGLLLISLFSLIFWLGRSITSPVLPLYIRSFDVSMSEVGLVSITRSMGFAVFEPTFGFLSDRIGRKKILITTTLASAVITFLYTLVNSFWQFLPISFTLSAMTAGIVVTRRALIADVMSPSARGKSYGAFMGMLTLGGIIGPFLGGYLAEVTNYQIPFYVSFIIVTIGAVIVLPISEAKSLTSMRENTNDHIDNNSNNRSRLLSFGLVLFLMARMLQSFTSFFVRSILPIYAKESVELKATESQIGVLVGVAGLIRAPFQLIFGALSDIVGRKSLIILGTAFAGLTSLSFLLVSNMSQLYLVRGVYAVCMVSYNLAMMVYLIDCVPSEKYGTAMGMYGLSEDIGGMLGPFIIGYFYDIRGITATIFCVSASMFIDIVIETASFRKFKLLRKDSLEI